MHLFFPAIPNSSTNPVTFAMLPAMSKVIVITGPCGSGKTTVANLLSKNLGIPHLRGDAIKEELFPALLDISKHPRELAAVKTELLRRTKAFYESKQSVIVDYIVLGDYISAFQRTFGEALVFKVLLPTIEVNTQRDAQRECWQAGKNHIAALAEDFRAAQSLIGQESFIDNSRESAEETVTKILESLEKGVTYTSPFRFLLRLPPHPAPSHIQRNRLS